MLKMTLFAFQMDTQFTLPTMCFLGAVSLLFHDRQLTVPPGNVIPVLQLDGKRDQEPRGRGREDSKASEADVDGPLRD